MRPPTPLPPPPRPLPPSTAKPQGGHNNGPERAQKPPKPIAVVAVPTHKTGSEKSGKRPEPWVEVNLSAASEIEKPAAEKLRLDAKAAVQSKASTGRGETAKTEPAAASRKFIGEQMWKAVQCF